MNPVTDVTGHANPATGIKAAGTPAGANTPAALSFGDVLASPAQRQSREPITTAATPAGGAGGSNLPATGKQLPPASSESTLSHQPFVARETLGAAPVAEAEAVPAAARTDGIERTDDIEKIDGTERVPEVAGKFVVYAERSGGMPQPASQSGSASRRNGEAVSAESAAVDPLIIEMPRTVPGPAAETVRGVAPAFTPGTGAPQFDTQFVAQAVSARSVPPVMVNVQGVRQDIASRMDDPVAEAGAVREVRGPVLESGESVVLKQFTGRVSSELALAGKMPELPMELGDKNVETALGRTHTQVQPQAPVSGLGAALAAAYTDAGAVKAGHLPAINVAPHDPAFGDQLAGRVTMMVRDGQSEARVQLNPPELGRLDIRISTDGDQARIMVMAQGADTRDAIEQALPRLREMLEQSGLQLSRFDVSNGSGSRHGGTGPFAASGDSIDGDGDPAEQAFEAERRDRVAVAPMSLVDFYA